GKCQMHSFIANHRAPQAPKCNGSAADPTQKTTTGAFSRFPNCVSRNATVTAEQLIVLAFRSTFVGEFALKSEVISSKPSVGRAGIAKGFGRDRAERAIRGCIEGDWLDRKQLPGKQAGTFGPMSETLRLPEPTGQGFRHVRRSWFDGRRTVNALAALI